MTKVLDKNVLSGGVNITDAFFIVGSKVVSEELLMRTPIGNGTLRSGLVKTASALVLSMMSKNKYVSYVNAGLLIDGVEDIISHVRSKSVIRADAIEVL